MQVTDVPVLPPETSLADAGEAMHRRGVSAVATQRNGELVLLTPNDMHAAVVAQHCKGEGPGLTLSDVPVSPDQLQLMTGRTASRWVHTLSISPSRSLLGERPATRFSIVEHTHELARVVSFNVDTYGTMNKTLTQGTCRDPQHHKWWPFELIVAGICNTDSTVVDFV